MKNENRMDPSLYREDVMTESTCLICGENLKKYGYVYQGKLVCRDCINYIRSNY